MSYIESYEELTMPEPMKFGEAFMDQSKIFRVLVGTVMLLLGVYLVKSFAMNITHSIASWILWIRSGVRELYVVPNYEMAAKLVRQRTELENHFQDIIQRKQTKHHLEVQELEEQLKSRQECANNLQGKLNNERIDNAARLRRMKLSSGDEYREINYKLQVAKREKSELERNVKVRQHDAEAVADDIVKLRKQLADHKTLQTELRDAAGAMSAELVKLRKQAADHETLRIEQRDAAGAMSAELVKLRKQAADYETLQIELRDSAGAMSAELVGLRNQAANYDEVQMELRDKALEIQRLKKNVPTWTKSKSTVAIKAISSDGKLGKLQSPLTASDSTNEGGKLQSSDGDTCFGTQPLHDSPTAIFEHNSAPSHDAPELNTPTLEMRSEEQKEPEKPVIEDAGQSLGTQPTHNNPISFFEHNSAPSHDAPESNTPTSEMRSEVQKELEKPAIEDAGQNAGPFPDQSDIPDIDMGVESQDITGGHQALQTPATIQNDSPSSNISEPREIVSTDVSFVFSHTGPGYRDAEAVASEFDNGDTVIELDSSLDPPVVLRAKMIADLDPTTPEASTSFGELMSQMDRLFLGPVVRKSAPPKREPSTLRSLPPNQCREASSSGASQNIDMTPAEPISLASPATLPVNPIEDQAVNTSQPDIIMTTIEPATSAIPTLLFPSSANPSHAEVNCPDIHMNQDMEHEGLAPEIVEQPMADAPGPDPQESSINAPPTDVQWEQASNEATKKRSANTNEDSPVVSASSPISSQDNRRIAPVVSRRTIVPRVSAIARATPNTSLLAEQQLGSNGTENASSSTSSSRIAPTPPRTSGVNMPLLAPPVGLVRRPKPKAANIFTTSSKKIPRKSPLGIATSAAASGVASPGNPLIRKAAPEKDLTEASTVQPDRAQFHSSGSGFQDVLASAHTNERGTDHVEEITCKRPRNDGPAEPVLAKPEPLANIEDIFDLAAIEEAQSWSPLRNLQQEQALRLIDQWLIGSKFCEKMDECTFLKSFGAFDGFDFAGLSNQCSWILGWLNHQHTVGHGAGLFEATGVQRIAIYIIHLCGAFSAGKIRNKVTKKPGAKKTVWDADGYAVPKSRTPAGLEGKDNEIVNKEIVEKLRVWATGILDLERCSQCELPVLPESLRGGVPCCRC